MTLPDLVLYDEEFRKIKESLQRLASDANANVVFLVDKNGQQIAAVGDIQSIDTTSLAMSRRRATASRRQPTETA